MSDHIAPTRIAIVHERLTEIAGSEHVVEQLALEWPDARIHVPIADPKAITNTFAGRVQASPLDRLHRTIRRRSHAPVLPFVPAAMRRVDFGDVDALVVSHHALAVSVVPDATVPTIAYVHSPARWAWDKRMRAGEANNLAARAALYALARQARRTESAAAPKITQIVANSTEVASRIANWWNRDALIVFPPVDTQRYVPDPSVEREDFFLLAGRLVPYKRPDIAVRAAKAAGVRLIVAGAGRQAAQCAALAGPETTFLGRVDDATMLSLMRRARAVIMPGVEDFGIVPVEAMATATPVIAVGSGGALDTVVAGLSGELVEYGDDQTIVAGLTAAMRDFDESVYDRNAMRAHAERFSRAAFRSGMRNIVDSVINES